MDSTLNNLRSQVSQSTKTAFLEAKSIPTETAKLNEIIHNIEKSNYFEMKGVSKLTCDCTRYCGDDPNVGTGSAVPCMQYANRQVTHTLLTFQIPSDHYALNVAHELIKIRHLTMTAYYNEKISRSSSIYLGVFRIQE